MTIPTDDPDEFLILIEDPEPQADKTNIVAKIRFTPDGIRREYLYHERFVQDPVTGKWEAKSQFRPPHLSGADRALIRWGIRCHVEDDFLRFSGFDEEPGPDRLPGVDRRRLMMILVAGAINREPHPRNLGAAVHWVRQCFGLSKYAMAKAVGCTSDSIINRLETGERSAAATTLERIAQLADRAGLRARKSAEYIRVQANLARHKTYEKGGHR